MKERGREKGREKEIEGKRGKEREREKLCRLNQEYKIKTKIRFACFIQCKFRNILEKGRLFV